MSFLKKGKAAQQEVSKEHAAQEARREARENSFPRFWMNKGQTKRITFLDGGLMDDGLMELTQFYSHGVKIQNRWEMVVCTAHDDKTQPCPVCEGGDYSSLVAAFTVIDHSKFVSKAGKTYQHETKLFLAKTSTIAKLQKLANTRGGLDGVTFNVSRSETDNAPNVGDVFDFVGQMDAAAIAEKFDSGIIDYETAIQYYTPEQLRSMGFGEQQKAGTTKPPPSGKAAATSEADYFDDDDAAAPAASAESGDGEVDYFEDDIPF